MTIPDKSQILVNNSASAPELTRIPYQRIQPSKGWVSLKLSELWKYRELLYFLTWRDIKVRYKQTVLGAAWAILQPFMTMIVFSLFFGGLAQIPSDGVPYPIFSFTALVPWTFFATGLSMAADSLVGSANLITQKYRNGMLIDNDNPQSIAEGINTILSNDALAKSMGQGSLKAFDEEFNYAKQYLPALERFKALASQ